MAIESERIITIPQEMPAPIFYVWAPKKAEPHGFIGSLNDILISGCLRSRNSTILTV